MKGKYSICVQSLVYAGLIATALGAVVSGICGDRDNLIKCSVDFGIWVFNYIMHTKVFKTW